VRDAQVLVIQGVVNFPTEGEIASFRQMKLLREGKIHVPVTGRPDGGIAKSHSSELPPLIIDARIRSIDNGGIRPKWSLECGWIEPLVLLLRTRSTAAETRVSNQVWPACHRVTGYGGDRQRNTGLGIPVLGQFPSAQYNVGKMTC